MLVPVGRSLEAGAAKPCRYRRGEDRHDDIRGEVHHQSLRKVEVVPLIHKEDEKICRTLQYNKYTGQGTIRYILSIQDNMQAQSLT